MLVVLFSIFPKVKVDLMYVLKLKIILFTELKTQKNRLLAFQIMLASKENTKKYKKDALPCILL